jgi:cyclopropane fatty-acyl-phospholipid synthase-like methyltransferase
LRVGRLEDPLPGGPFDLVVSALAVHHLRAPGKADLFRRIAEQLTPGGRFVMGDVVVSDDAVSDPAPWIRALIFPIESATSRVASSSGASAKRPLVERRSRGHLRRPPDLAP